MKFKHTKGFQNKGIWQQEVGGRGKGERFCVLPFPFNLFPFPTSST
ncbi:hypothetical protein FDUTEX481_03898 [Tolypothrix sp. PCC 7601]|nr:hypothetical protein FDUTEX481_03898 [Tolypothrix sp. PCC 7601]